jgi:hypothetical protein
MTATVVVSPNQWNAIPGPSGEFALHDVPPGRYTIVAWHKTAGFFREPVEVRDGATRIEFIIPLAEDGTAASHETSTSTNSPSTNGPSTNSPHEVMSKR